MSSGKRVTRSSGRDSISPSEPRARGRSRRTLKKEESIDFPEEGPEKYIVESDCPQMTSDEIEKSMDKLDAACKSFEVEESGDDGETGDENKGSGSSQDNIPHGDLDKNFGSENEGFDSSNANEHLNKVSESMSEGQSEINKRALEDMSVDESDEGMQPNHESPKEDGQEEYNVDSPTRSDEDQDNNGALEEVSDDNEKKDDSLEYDKSRSLEHDTEMVSEDELPSEVSKPPLDTEAVSDEELPNMVADSLDTEAVSDDEFPQEGKKKKKSEYKRNQSNGEPGPPNKRQAIESKSGKPQANSKVLPELEKYWKAVRDDSTDFTGWTYLLQYVDQENDVDAAREAYDSFLSHYPYCYGYWRKYADYEKRKGEKAKCEEVFERGLKAIPLSVDLWIHYLNYCKNVYKDDEDHLRSQFERAITVCGLEFRSDRLWESYIKWETEGKNLQRVCEIYDRLITTPTQGYTTHFENFEDFVMSNQPNKILPVDEFLSLRSEVLHELKQKTGQNPAPAPVSNAPPGDESDEEEKSPTYADEETTMMREKIIAARKKVFKSTVSCVLARWTFEEGIKRPYFHVKPLERSQLTNWRNYLEFETSEPDQERAIILFERCLIACALYDEFWMKFIRYLESLPQDMTEKIRDVYERACTIHHPRKPMLSLNWAIFEESQGNIDAARQVLLRLESELPNLLHVLSRRINLERRCGNYDEVCSLYDHYISSSDDKTTVNTMVLKYARFCCKILNDPNKGLEILKRAVEKEKDNVRFYLQMLGIMLGQKETNEDEFVTLINQVLERESIDLEYKVLFSQRKVEFLEEFGTNVKSLNKANLEYLSFLKQFKDRKRKQHEDKVKQDDMKKSKVEGSSSSHSGVTGPISSSYSSSYSQPSGTSASNSSGASNQNSSNYQSNTNGTQYQQQSYSQPPFNQYSQSDQNYNNYQNWSYSQPGYGNYNQGWGGYNYYS